VNSSGRIPDTYDPTGDRQRSFPGLPSVPLSAGLVSSGLICPSVLALRATPRHAADSRCVMGLPYGSLTRSYLCCCMPIFVLPYPCAVRLDGGQDAMTHRRRDFVQAVRPDTPVIFSTVTTCETQRVSPASSGTTFSPTSAGSDIRSTSTTDRGLRPVLRTRPDHPPPQICLPSTFRYGHCVRLRPAAF